MKIANVDLKKSGKAILVEVSAIAPSLGWTNVGLSVVQYVTPPMDGVQDIILTATAPTGPVATPIQLFELSATLDPAIWFQGVRIKNAAGTESWVLRNPTVKKQPVGNSGFGAELPEIKDDKLNIRVSYGGGCKEHSFQLNWDGIIMESFPPQVRFDLSHDNHGDTCMALLSDTLVFDLSAIKDFPEGVVDILMQVHGEQIKLRYTPPKMKAALAIDKQTIPVPVIKRGFSDKYDLAEAIHSAIKQLPDRSGGTIDFLSHYTVKQIGAEIGGIAGLNRLFVDVEG